VFYWCMIDFVWRNEMIKVFIICMHQSPWIHNNSAFKKGKGELEYCSVLNVGTQSSKNMAACIIITSDFYSIRNIVLMLSLSKLLSLLWDLRFSQWCWCGFMSSGMWHYVIGWVVPNIWKALHSFEMSGTIHRTQHHFPTYMNSQLAYSKAKL
jgi:hypothetical protein